MKTIQSNTDNELLLFLNPSLQKPYYLFNFRNAINNCEDLVIQFNDINDCSEKFQLFNIVIDTCLPEQIYTVDIYETAEDGSTNIEQGHYLQTIKLKITDMNCCPTFLFPRTYIEQFVKTNYPLKKIISVLPDVFSDGEAGYTHPIPRKTDTDFEDRFYFGWLSLTAFLLNDQDSTFPAQPDLKLRAFLRDQTGKDGLVMDASPLTTYLVNETAAGVFTPTKEAENYNTNGYCIFNYVEELYSGSANNAISNTSFVGYKVVLADK